MSLVSSTIANLINGVSQQPSALRLASQCELQENCNSSVVDGLCKRNGTRHRAKALNTPLTNAFTHLINRDETERYRVMIFGGAIRVFDLDGVEKTVNLGTGASGYLTSSSPADDFAAMTVADYTFVLNKTKIVQQSSTDFIPTRPNEALVWIKQGVADGTYVLTVDGFTGHFKCGNAQSFPDQVTTNAIAAGLSGNASGATPDYLGLQQAMGAAASNYVIQTLGSTIRIARVDGGDFSIVLSDPYGDQATQLIKKSTQRFTNLPAKAISGFKTEVQGEGGSFNTSYWVEYITDANNPNGGVWKETCKPGEVKSIDPTTLPYVLVREADGTFTFKPGEWEPRKVGDIDKSNPMPSFIGRKLNDIFFHRNRLGVLSDENLVFSTAGEYFNFFKGSAIQILDTDPIDIGVSSTKVSILRHAVPWNETLLLFSDQTQFMLGKTNDILSVKTASIDATTEFECSSAVKPIGVGNFVYFVQNRNSHSAVREFGVDEYTQTKDAQDVTAHVPKYIPDGVFKLTASNTESIIVALSHNEPSKLFIYQFFVSGESKLQSAWHTWTFGEEGTILNADFLGSELHLLISRPDGVYMEVLPVATSVTEGAQQFSVHLDRAVDETQVTGLSFNGTTTSFTLPYTVDDPSQFVLVAWEGNDVFKVGRKVPFTITGGNVVTVSALSALSHFRFGQTITARYVFSQLEVREQAAGGGQTSVGEGRINVRRMTLRHGNSGYFRVEVTPRGRDTYTNVMSGRQVGSGVSLLGEVALTEGAFRVPVMTRNTDATIELVSEEFLPFSILSADWEGMFVIRSRRI
jgi:hypothetical protein